MGYYVSALIKGMDSMGELADWINSEPIPNLGIELIAFTHDELYWKKLRNILEKITCPITFHGPYIKVEATSAEGSPEYDWMMESYQRVFALAKEYQVKHVVFHYTQKGFQPDTIKMAQEISKKNITTLIKMAEEYQVNMLIENIAFPKNSLPLYNNEEYFNIFEENPKALSIIDIGHAHINKMNIEQFLRVYGNRVKAYHLHNNNGIQDQHNSILNGSFDYASLFPLIKKYTPDADLVLEYEPHTNMSQKELLDDLYYIEKHLL